MRSRAVFLPWACCFSTALAEPACAGLVDLRRSSASLPAVVWMSGALLAVVIQRFGGHWRLLGTVVGVVQDVGA